MWMFLECLRHDPERHIWIWFLIVFNFPGAVIYFVLRRLSYKNLPVSKHFQRWTRRRELWNAEAAAKNIGKAHQFVLLGNLLIDLDIWDRAANAFQIALEKEPNNLQALWGAILIDRKNNKFESAKKHLETLLKIDKDYKYGDASLLYVKTILSLQDIEKAKTALEEHIKYWGKPEAYFLMAEIQFKEGKSSEARRLIDTMLQKLRSSPKFYYRQHRSIERKAQRLLRALPQ
jgi:hypothetical protein